MLHGAAQKAAAVAVGALVSTVQALVGVRDWFGARREAPFRGR